MLKSTDGESSSANIQVFFVDISAHTLCRRVKFELGQIFDAESHEHQIFAELEIFSLSLNKVWNLPDRTEKPSFKKFGRNLNSNKRCAEKVFYAVLDLSMGRLFCRK